MEGMQSAQIQLSTPFQELLRREPLPHAVLIEGARGGRKNNWARLLAQRAVCTAAGEKPCGVCAGCQKAMQGVHPDILIMEGTGARTLHVDDVRSIRGDAYVRANEAPYKVYLLLEADGLTEQAQNALLKVLEEPPPQVIFVLTCTSAVQLLPTIRSRTQLYACGGEREEPVQAAAALAESIALAVAAPKEYALLKQTASLAKDRPLLRAVLSRLLLIFRDACVLASGGSERLAEGEAAAYLAVHVPRKALLCLIDTVRRALQLEKKNVNQTLLVTWLCFALRQGIRSNG
jgi:hypothetical protein